METQTQMKVLANEQFQDIFSPELVNFLTELHQKFNGRRLELLTARKAKQNEFDLGKLPSFPKETEEIRNGDWVCNPVSYTHLRAHET